MKTFELKELKISESDFTFLNNYTERCCGREYKMKRYEVPRERLLEPNTSLKSVYGHCYELREVSDYVLAELSEDTSIDSFINKIKHLHKVWQLGNYLCGQHSTKDAKEIFEKFKVYFYDKEFPKERLTYNHTEQEQAALELGLGVNSVCFISRQDSELYITGPETVYTTPEQYGKIPVYVHIDKDKVSLWFASRYDQTFLGKSLMDYHEKEAFEKYFDRKEPQRFSLGKLTEKKKHDWFSYIRDYSNEAMRFFSERNNAVSIAEKKLKDAGFERIGESNEWKCSKGYFDCRATIYTDGTIRTDISIAYDANVREEVFNI